MGISPSSSAIQLVNTSMQKATTAAEDINKASIQNNEVGSSTFEQQDILKPILSLTEAELETSAAVKLLEADTNMLGSLLDIKV
ncbi:MAG: hypothetical protein methR_P3268 [Methyloprofundus sp.]|nr:MAG: hypothetical protein methR_P3268 [Methyloprofundus sp.]